MVCPSCGALIDGRGKFCSICGAQLPEAAASAPVWSQLPAAAAPAAPPPWQPSAPQPAAPAGQGYGSAPGYGAPPQYGGPVPYGAPPQYGGQQYGQPQYGTPPQPYYGAPQYSPGSWGAYAAPATGSAGSPLGALLAALGGLVAVVAAWLPVATMYGFSLKLIDATDTSTLACGYYLVVGGGAAVVAGFLLLLRAGGSARPLLGLVAIGGGILVVAVEVATYGQLNDTMGLGSSLGGSLGSLGTAGWSYGLYAGAGAGVISAVGGLIVLAQGR
jgi:hypothetical protein